MFNLTTKALGYVAGALGLATIAAGSFAGVQTFRLDQAKHRMVVLAGAVTAEKGRADIAVTEANQRGIALGQRDLLIAEQSASLDRVSSASAANRERYLATIRGAEVLAKNNESRAAELAAPPPAPPSDKCEAARSLIIQELQNVR
jgi:hypothetical protein